MLATGPGVDGDGCDQHRNVPSTRTAHPSSMATTPTKPGLGDDQSLHPKPSPPEQTAHLAEPSLITAQYCPVDALRFSAVAPLSSGTSTVHRVSVPAPFGAAQVKVRPSAVCAASWPRKSGCPNSSAKEGWTSLLQDAASASTADVTPKYGPLITTFLTNKLHHRTSLALAST